MLLHQKFYFMVKTMHSIFWLKFSGSQFSISSELSPQARAPRRTEYDRPHSQSHRGYENSHPDPSHQEAINSRRTTFSKVPHTTFTFTRASDDFYFTRAYEAL